MLKQFSFFSSWKVLDVNTDWIGTGLIKIYTNCLGSYSSPQWECGPLSPPIPPNLKTNTYPIWRRKSFAYKCQKYLSNWGRNRCWRRTFQLQKCISWLSWKMGRPIWESHVRVPEGQKADYCFVLYSILQASENWKLPYADLPTLYTELSRGMSLQVWGFVALYKCATREEI